MSTAMTPDGDLYRRAAARCITRATHLDADQLPPCSACLLAIASSASSARAAHLLAGADDGVTGATPSVPPGSAPVAPTSSERRYSMTCRFDGTPGHQCRRRDGAMCGPEYCHAEHRAQVGDLAHLGTEIDAIGLVPWLLDRRSEWDVDA